jgi:hypothetical protein
VETGRLLRVLTQDLAGFVYACALSPDGRWALGGESHLNQNQPLWVWDLLSGKLLRRFAGHTGDVRAVAFSLDGQFGISGSHDKTVRVWDLASGACLAVLKGHTAPVTALAISADGRFVLSGGGDALRLWELDWDLAAREASDWDAGLDPLAQIFLTLLTPYGALLSPKAEPAELEIAQALARRGAPTWSEEAWRRFAEQLQHGGFGWVRPDGVRRKLLELAQSWEGPPPAPAPQLPDPKSKTGTIRPLDPETARRLKTFFPPPFKRPW